jgi:hypothetical protein
LALDDVRVRTESVDCPWSVPIIREHRETAVIGHCQNLIVAISFLHYDDNEKPK